MRVIIAGSRTGVPSALVEKCVQGVVKDNPGVTVVTGGARGVDTIAHSCAVSLGVTTEVFPAKWDLYGKSAGFLRNVEMAEAGADICYCIYSGRRTPGTMNMARVARERGIRVIELGLENVTPP